MPIGNLSGLHFCTTVSCTFNKHYFEILYEIVYPFSKCNLCIYNVLRICSVIWLNLIQL